MFLCRSVSLQLVVRYLLVLRPSEILLETRSARLKVWMLKLARSLEPPLGLSYRYGDQVYVCSKFARLARKFWVLKLAR